MPEGSSSDAPVTNPGPMARRYWRQIGPSYSGVRSNSDRCEEDWADCTCDFPTLGVGLGFFAITYERSGESADGIPAVPRTGSSRLVGYWFTQLCPQVESGEQ